MLRNKVGRPVATIDQEILFFLLFIFLGGFLGPQEAWKTHQSPEMVEGRGTSPDFLRIKINEASLF